MFLPGKSHGQRNLADGSPWDCKESDTTELVPVPGESGPDTFTRPVRHLLRAISANLMNYSGPMCSPSRGILEASPFHKYLENWQVI